MCNFQSEPCLLNFSKELKKSKFLKQKFVFISKKQKVSFQMLAVFFYFQVYNLFTIIRKRDKFCSTKLLKSFLNKNDEKWHKSRCFPNVTKRIRTKNQSHQFWNPKLQVTIFCISIPLSKRLYILYKSELKN